MLALTYIKFFQSFGTFVFLNILFSTLYAFVGAIQPPVRAVAAPTGAFATTSCVPLQL